MQKAEAGKRQKAESRRLNRFALGATSSSSIPAFFRLPPSAFRLCCCLLSTFCLLPSAFCFACPFCTAVKPTLVQQRESAAVAFLGECTAADANAKPAVYNFAVRRWFNGQSKQNGHDAVRLPLTNQIKVGTLALVLGTGDNDTSWNKLDWQCVPLSELAFVYVAQSPDLRTPAAKRLQFFAKYLENRDPVIAEDAFQEFGQVPYDVVAPAAAELSASKLREWIAEPNVPDERKGFYGLALGLTAKGDDWAKNLARLRSLIDADAPAGADFRVGFDGILGGYLVAEGPAAIEHISDRLLANSKSAVGDVRHAEKALRFYYEYGPADQRPAVAKAVEHLLDRPSESAAAITDLARWQDWKVVDKIAPLYDRKDDNDAFIQRAVIGYLLACPLPEASQSLARLRQHYPKGVADAEQTLAALGGKN
jgi:hypothetical protein